MKPFRYGRDPLFLVGCALYAANRWWWKPHLPGAILHGYFNDFLLIPCALPPLLLAHRLLRWRRDDAPPSGAEIAGHLLAWSMLFEWIGPRFVPGTTADPWDVAAYATGALVAWLWWHRERPRACQSRRVVADADPTCGLAQTGRAVSAPDIPLR